MFIKVVNKESGRFVDINLNNILSIEEFISPVNLKTHYTIVLSNRIYIIDDNEYKTICDILYGDFDKTQLIKTEQNVI